MAFTLPNLDDRRWADFVDEARSLIPYYAPQWTNENPSDPGITLIELLAWVADMDVYEINRIPQSHLRKFLELIDLSPALPRPARTVSALGVEPGSDPLSVPAGLEFEAHDPAGNPVPVRVLDALTIVDIAISLVMVQDAANAVASDRTSRFQRGQIFGAFGQDPVPGSALYLGFNRQPKVGTPLRLYFQIAGHRAGEEERWRIEEQNERRLDDCRPACWLSPCCETSVEPPADAAETSQAATQVVSHHSARTVWEYASADGWSPLQEATEVVDQTRQFTLSGPVTLVWPPIELATIGVGEPASHFVRCRFASGAFDSAPSIAGITINAAEVEQAVPATAAFEIDSHAIPTGPPPTPTNSTRRVSFDVNDRFQIDSILFASPDVPKASFYDSPELRVLAYSAPAGGGSGTISLEILRVGISNGRPVQRFTLPGPVLINSRGPRVFTSKAGQWHEWELREDFDASGPTDRHVVIDAGRGTIQFGDGRRGRVPEDGTIILADGLVTLGSRGNLAAGTTFHIRDSRHNVWQLATAGKKPPVSPADYWHDDLHGLSCVLNPFPATGGGDGQTIAQAAAQAPKQREAVHRAVTLSDYETLALCAPGVQLARAAAIVDVHPSFPCSRALGFVTVVVLPFLPRAQPVPSGGLLRAVRAWLEPRRVVGTNVIVAGPVYTTVAVQATVVPARGAVSADVQKQVGDALDQFFNALHGGESGKGWPLGRPVYRAEVLQVIAGVSGVDHVASLALIAGDGPPTCSNVCIGSLGLVAAGTHQITIATAPAAAIVKCPQPAGTGNRPPSL